VISTREAVSTTMVSSYQATTPLTDIAVHPDYRVDIFADIPDPYKLSVEEILKLAEHPFNLGHFATKLVGRLFPELFGPGDVRKEYSYFGGGIFNKTELDPERKKYIQRYVLYIFPQMADRQLWKSVVVVKVDELL